MSNLHQHTCRECGRLFFCRVHCGHGTRSESMTAGKFCGQCRGRRGHLPLATHGHTFERQPILHHGGHPKPKVITVTPGTGLAEDEPL